MVDGKRPFTRRSLLLGASLGAAATLLPAMPASAAPSYTGVPKLPNEISRLDTKVTSKGTPYEVINIQVKGDLAQLFVPHSARVSRTRPTNFVWFYHANNSRYTALSSAFQWPAEQFVDDGWVSICPDFGAATAPTGSAWTNKVALQAQWDMAAWVGYQWQINASFLRANSGGGSLMTLAYGKQWIPALRGMYLASATYNLPDLYDRDPGRLGPPYAAEIPATSTPEAYLASSTRNAAALPQSAWRGARIRVAAATNDLVVPASVHGLALVAKAAPVAADASSRTFTTPIGSGILGHFVPDWVNGETVSFFRSWA